ncbi:uncharacterized protein LOC112693561 isoform X2 [Sipha flava]|uniref:Uncharacterized protein LOC112693561 isoform X1 n=2 Tax=Sipha flava TaxID=143950 RepID=A0A8B8GPD9_9HEMI|nr:uncharacterized protein LOC112693561 isoform X1 [Sipha flava]XP_025424467.1 uncharacterized protein LOC112693561 isoform X2 [Sipha flava]
MPPLKSLPIPPIVTPLVALVLTTLVLATCSAAPDISMSIHGGVGTSGDDREKSSFTVNQIHTILSSIEFRLRDLSNTMRRDQQIERINSRIDVMLNKLSHLEVSNGLWFDKFQQSVVEECGPNHMTRRLDKAQHQLEITLEHMETTLQTVHNHQKELEKEIKKVTDRQTEMSADIQSMRKDMSNEFNKHNSSQNAFREQLQETVSNFFQQSKIVDKSLNTCLCNQNDDPSQLPDTTTTNKLATTVNSMYNGLKERSDDMQILLKELIEITDKYRRRLDSDRHDVISEFLDSFMEAAISEIAAIQKKSEQELEAKFKEQLQLLVDGQNLFMVNCHRLQSNEHQIENDMVFILERIMNHIDNKTISETTALEQISKTLKTQRSQEEKMFAELSELGKTQTDQVVRTVAYSTNQVIKLHQDVMNISNALMVANCGGSPSNGTTTINATDVNSALNIHHVSNNKNPLMIKNKSEKPTTTQQHEKSNARGKPTTTENNTQSSTDGLQ